MNIKWVLFIGALVLFPILFILLFQVFVRDQMLEFKAVEAPGLHEVEFPIHIESDLTRR